jgi:transposase
VRYEEQTLRPAIKPPSSDGLKRSRSLRSNTSRRKPGHPGERLHPSAKPDEVACLPLEQCPKCQGDLSGQPMESEEVRQVFELPPIKLRVTEYRTAQKRCLHCGRFFTASFPAGVTAPTQYGPRMQAVMSYLKPGNCSRMSALRKYAKTSLATGPVPGASYAA